MSEVKLELRKDAPFTVQQVLEWASDHTCECKAWLIFGVPGDREWTVWLRTSNTEFKGTTLYDALYEAWKSRGEK